METRRTNKTKTRLKNHANYNPVDYAYLSDKGYTDAEIEAIWDRDAALGQPAQKHTNSPQHENRNA